MSISFDGKNINKNSMAAASATVTAASGLSEVDKLKLDVKSKREKLHSARTTEEKAAARKDLQEAKKKLSAAKSKIFRANHPDYIPMSKEQAQNITNAAQGIGPTISIFNK